MSPSLHVERAGTGPPVLLVHGSVAGGASTWSAQMELANRWTLLVVDRPGYGAAPDVEGEDFEVDAELVAEQLGVGAHVVGQSYGGVVSLLAAARRPQAVRSLTLIEPPAFSLAEGDPAVDDFVATMRDHWEQGPGEPEAFLHRFLELVGSRVELPSPLSPSLGRGARVLMGHRAPWEAQIQLDTLVRAPFPKLVVSGRHHAAFDAVCDVLEERLGAERAVIAGAGHSVQRTGARFNERLERFLKAAETRGD